jgi:excisionase family DNA binding protein
MSEAGPYEELLRALTVERFTRPTQSSRRPGEDTGGSARGGAVGDDGAASALRRPPRGGPSAGKLLLRVEEAAALLDVGRTRIYDLITSGALQSVKIGGSRRVPAAALQRYVDELLHDNV